MARIVQGVVDCIMEITVMVMAMIMVHGGDHTSIQQWYKPF